MDGIRKLTDLLANIAIIVVAILLSVVLVKNYLLHKTPVSNVNNPSRQSVERRVGERVALPRTEWQKSGRTLLLALSTTCHFCSDSGPFYQQLAKERSSDTRLVAVLPQPENAGKSYLSKLGVPVDDVQQASLDSLGARGTPTLLLVDSGGQVLDSWVGKLPASEEAEVLSKVREGAARQ
ncbi:MAG TPA: hypothetical protein VF546_18255 [Pyrinomonadaceae bacterium]|jgi:thioredoxin-related protein